MADLAEPSSADQVAQQAIANHAAGRLSEAEANYRWLISRNPRDAAALHGLGVVAYQTGHIGDAIGLLDRSLQMRPDFSETLNALGLALRDARQLDRAIAAHRRATEVKPLDAAGFTHLGLALRDMGLMGEAEHACRHAIALDPENPLPWNNLGTVCMRAGKYEEAEGALKEALRRRPEYVKALNNLGTTQLSVGRAAAAVATYDRALQIAPNYAEVHWHRSIALLTLGDWERGWAEYEWRWNCAEYQKLRHVLPQPLWDGSNPAGKTILLTPEQGLGDSIQFVRYVALLARRGARVWVACQPELVGLFANLAGADRVIDVNALAGGELGESAWDWHLPLLSLPLRFATRPETVPSARAYLFADAGKAGKWRQRLQVSASAGTNVKRVGLVWAGRAIPDPLRTCGLAALAPLAEVMGVRFISVQVGDAAAEANNPPAGMRIDNFSDALSDFTETAGLIANLDMIITIDSAVAHLAGALGCPSWTLLRDVADWRWLERRQDTPWYPTMRLFRQERRGDWASVAARVAGELRTWLN
ncbi:MAG TPA: tetratricopeptide repeat protein [Tepidisphaeraceae bacterium]|nr:tetratricopeptide repeat protein [Tepidisphaeraceae bacterium]